ncbi:hypothetical protein TPHA_0J01730 [Tetrapisispora phaffii CBS 4417]|uniref:Uncharacterized protein n=1 Tax=Tetrapisispora phaffii (strain ATCC 24235 / CBS 4417 / NBRC 1672 / NRRL Y-8282 / UCD 70-5) TaxID=1071381 RepID=G8BYQ2_TETPH|nr:hypothetical protein TPHA_0J01730 [Tetrapisispora phaffii CBS 4417]CCE64994.1 hypothetical protein TPHA_0J01730 [Tetrapisispora phaffii CBS 4417]
MGYHNNSTVQSNDGNFKRVPLSDVSNKVHYISHDHNITSGKQTLSKSKQTSYVGNEYNLGVTKENDDENINAFVKWKEDDRDIDFDILSAGSDKYIDIDKRNIGKHTHTGILSESLSSSSKGDLYEELVNDPYNELKHSNDIDSYEIDQIDQRSITSENDLSFQCNDPLRPIYNSEIQDLLDSAYKKCHKPFPDLQDQDTYDVVMVVEYSDDIFKYINELAMKLSPDPYYIRNQKELKWSYRSILIDWIINVHQRFKLLPETLFLTINLIDRFLSKKECKLNKFQLVGITALFIAAKYEEINCPTLNDLVYMLDKAYTGDEVLEAEMYMINTLDFEIGWPGPLSFLRRISKADNYCFEIRTLAKYILELTLMDPKLIGANPSWLAAGAYYLSKIILGFITWSLEHVYYSGYTQEQVFPLATNILEICKDAKSNCEAIWTKYSQKKYSRVSTTVDKWINLAEEKLSDQEEPDAY